MIEGLIAMRKMHIRAIEESGLTCADEMLYPENWGYVEDLLSYVAIGARSVEDQQHRLTVSGFDVASGMRKILPVVIFLLCSILYTRHSIRIISFIADTRWRQPEIL